MYFTQRNNDVCLYKNYHQQKLIFLSVQLGWFHCFQNSGALSGWETTHAFPLPTGVGWMSPFPLEGLERLDTLQAGITYNLPWEKHSSKHAGCLDTLDLLCHRCEDYLQAKGRRSLILWLRSCYQMAIWIFCPEKNCDSNPSSNFLLSVNCLRILCPLKRMRPASTQLKSINRISMS